MKAGALRHQVTIQSASTVSDGAGGHTKAWADGATVYAAIAPVTGSEPFLAHQEQSAVSHVVKLRHRTLAASSRLKFGTRIFKIESVLNPDERSRELMVLCEEVK